MRGEQICISPNENAEEEDLLMVIEDEEGG